MQVQTVLNELTFTLMRLLNPIIPFTMDEVNQNYPLATKENVMYYEYPKESHDYDGTYLERYKLIKQLREKVLGALELARTSGLIGSAQEATVLMNLKDAKVVEEVKNFSTQELRRLFIVSDVKFDSTVTKNDSEIGAFDVIKHEGTKCDRCWNYFDDDEIHEVEGAHLCERCLKALKK